MNYPPLGSPPRERRHDTVKVVALIVAGVVAVAAIIAATIVLTSDDESGRQNEQRTSSATPSTGTLVLKADQVAKDVGTQYQSEFDEKLTNLTCDDPLVVVPGAEYECTGRADGDEVTITIEITDELGSYTWSRGA